MKRIVYIILLVFLLADLGYSFFQYLHQPLDGDMAAGIIPGDDVQPILNNPLGINAIVNHKTYPNPNRYFSHLSFYLYFNHVPIILQQFTNPIQSVYLACAIAKISFHIFLLFFITFFAVNTIRINLNFLSVSVLVAPLFQVNGFKDFMGVIDNSTTYAFFYAFPLILLLFYFLPIFKSFFIQQRLNTYTLLFILIPFSLIVSLSGPLNPGISLPFVCYYFITFFYLKTQLLNNKS